MHFQFVNSVRSVSEPYIALAGFSRSNQSIIKLPALNEILKLVTSFPEEASPGE
jgi:hypothetical protein